MQPVGGSTTMEAAVGMEVRGAENFAKLAADLRAASTTLQRDMLTAIERSVEPLQQDIPASARRTLPRRGGLAAKVAASSITIRRGRGGIQVLTSNGYQIKTMDAGTVRHPVFGNRNRWVSQ